MALKGLIGSRESTSGDNMGDFQVWGRGSFKTRNGYREVRKELKQGLVGTKGGMGARQASNGKK